MNVNVTPERVFKPAAKLQPGDVLITLDEVLYVRPYTDDVGNPQMLIAIQPQSGPPTTMRGHAVEEFGLATDAEIADAAERAKRDRYVADLRTFANWFEERPWLPLPYARRAQAAFLNEADDEAVLNEAHALAELLGVKASIQDDRVTVQTQVGSFEFVIYSNRTKPADDPTGTGFSREDLDDGTPAADTAVPAGITTSAYPVRGAAAEVAR